MDAKVDEILLKYDNDKSQIIGILQDIQAEYNYLPYDALKHISEKLEIPLSKLYNISTFYAAFSLKPRGEHIISCCLGTACHVKGGLKVYEELQRLLNIESGETTEDGKFTLEAVNCLGTCALAPVVVIDGVYYEKVNISKINKILDKVREGKK